VLRAEAPFLGALSFEPPADGAAFRELDGGTRWADALERIR
jgi:hypothetical protein